MDVIDFKNQLFDLLRDINLKMVASFESCYEDYGLTMMQVRLLWDIHYHGEQTIGELGRSMMMASGNMSAMCKRLEKDGLLQRIRDNNDERVVRVALTERGNAIMRDVEKILHRRYCRVMDEMEETEVQELMNGLHRLDTALEAFVSCQEES